MKLSDTLHTHYRYIKHAHEEVSRFIPDVERNAPLHDKTNKMAFAQSDQSLRFPHEESLGP